MGCVFLPFECLTIFDWISDIVNSTLLVVKFFCVLIYTYAGHSVTSL